MTTQTTTAQRKPSTLASAMFGAHGRYALTVNIARDGNMWFGVSDANRMVDGFPEIIRQSPTLSKALEGLEENEITPFLHNVRSGDWVINLDHVPARCLSVDDERGILLQLVDGSKYYADPSQCKVLRDSSFDYSELED